MSNNRDSERPASSEGVDDILAAVSKITAAAGKIGGEARDFGPAGTRRLDRDAAIGMGLFLALFFAARVLLELDSLSMSLRVSIALLPLPAFAWFLWSFVRSITAADELERRIQLEALAVAFPLTILLIMTLGLLQIAVPLSPDDWSYRHIWPLLYVFYVVGLARARRRYV